jgi:hypothetical protein
VHVNYDNREVLVFSTDCIRDLSMTASKLYSHQHVSYMSSEALELLGLIPHITDNVPAFR